MRSRVIAFNIITGLAMVFSIPVAAQSVSPIEMEKNPLEIQLKTIDSCARAAGFVINAYDTHRTKEKLAAYMNDIFGTLARAPAKEEGMLTEKELMWVWLELHILIDTSGNPYAKEKREYYIARMAASCAISRN